MIFIKKTLLLNLLTIIITTSILYSEIKIIYSAALVGAHFDFRKKQYITSLECLHNFGYFDFYIIESCSKKGPTFFDNYSKNVFYATKNNSDLRNNGINEAITILEGCEHFNFQPDDMIIKITGRHKLTSNYLIETVNKNNRIDAFIKVNSHGNVFTVGFAMRYKYLKEMLENINYEELEAGMICIEYRVGDYIKKKIKNDKKFSVMYLKKLDIQANIFGSSTAPGAREEIINF